MAFDFGMTRIGVAVGNTSLKIPHPLSTITGRNKFIKFEQITQLVMKWQPQLLLVGMPDNLNKQLIINITKFSNRLKENFQLPVQCINEQYSSSMASEQLIEQGIVGIAQKEYLDQLAACNILATYFGSI